MRLVLALCVLVLSVVVGGLVARAATVDVATGSYYFEDATVGDGTISAEVGDQIRFLIEDGGRGTAHTIEIPALGVSSGPLATNSTYVTVVITQPGTFQVFCKPHRRRGHETTLVVTGQPAATTTTVATTTSTSGTATTTSVATTTAPTTPVVQSSSTTTTLGYSTTTQPQSPPTIPSSDTGAKTNAVGPEQTSETLPAGITKPETQQWTTALPAAIFGLVPLAVIAALAGTRNRVRRDD